MNRTLVGKLSFASVIAFCLLCVPIHASAQYSQHFNVDCSGNTPGAYTTINSVLPLLSNGSNVVVVGTCTENVALNSLNNITLGGYPGPMNLQGNLSINASINLIIHDMNVTNTSGDGIDVQNSLGISLYACSSTNNAGLGLDVESGSAVSIDDSGSYSNNASNGISVGTNSLVEIWAYSTPILASNNMGSGVSVNRSVFQAAGISLTNNKGAAGSAYNSGIGFNEAGSGFGIDVTGGSRVLLGGYFVFPNTITGNQGGGIYAVDGSEIAVCCGPPMVPTGQPNIIQGNGPVGISAGYGSSLQIIDDVQITNHTDVGVDVFGHSVVYIYGNNNQISNNGTDPSDPARAGLRVDGNSEAYLTEGGQISQNGGPGILALVNSSLDFSGVTFKGNSGGPVLCDSSSWMVSDLAGANPGANSNPGALMPCRVPNNLGRRPHPIPAFQVPDVSRFKALEAQYQQLMSTRQ